MPLTDLQDDWLIDAWVRVIRIRSEQRNTVEVIMTGNEEIKFSQLPVQFSNRTSTSVTQGVFPLSWQRRVWQRHRFPSLWTQVLHGDQLFSALRSEWTEQTINEIQRNRFPRWPMSNGLQLFAAIIYIRWVTLFEQRDNFRTSANVSEYVRDLTVILTSLEKEVTDWRSQWNQFVCRGFVPFPLFVATLIIFLKDSRVEWRASHYAKEQLRRRSYR